MNDLPGLARKALREARGDRDEAVKLLVKWIQDDPALAHQIIDRLLKEEAWRLIRSIVDSDRRAGRAEARPSEKHRTPVREETVRGLKLKGERALSELLSDAILRATGKRLGDATKIDISKEVDFLTEESESRLDTIRWYRSILNVMRDHSATERVSQVMNEVQLKNLQVRARRAREAERLQ